MINITEIHNGNLEVQVHPIIHWLLKKDTENIHKRGMGIKEKFGNTQDEEEQEMLLEFLEQEHEQNITVLRDFLNKIPKSKNVEISKEDANQLVQIFNYLKITTAKDANIGEKELDLNYTPKNSAEKEALSKMGIYNILSHNLLQFLI